jgi:hypothetical protein
VERGLYRECRRREMKSGEIKGGNRCRERNSERWKEAAWLETDGGAPLCKRIARHRIKLALF